MQPEDLMLLTDFYEYTMAYAYFKENKHEEIAYFDMFVRTIPDGGGFLILNGLHRFIDFVQNFHYTDAQIDYLRQTGYFDEDFLHYLKTMTMESGRYNTETQAIKAMLTQMQAWGRSNGIWVIIVAHPRSLKKQSGKDELEEIDMYTISGSANWANLADFIFSISRINQPDRNYTRLDMLKVRDQDLCRTGSVLFVRQPCGRYDERESEQQVMAEMQGKVLDKDRLPWIELLKKEEG